MKASDYIVEYLIGKGITDVFGYPGGMITHLMDSFSKYSDKITAHVTYHEQGAAFAACGYGQTAGKPGVAYATSGPGATNLITGICNAFFDSIPVIFITGQVNYNERKGGYGVRQRGFQETDIISMVSDVTKYAIYIDSVNKLPYELDKAYQIAMSGRRGPVLLDIPMNIFREDIENRKEKASDDENDEKTSADISFIENILKTELGKAKAPVLLLGNGIKFSNDYAQIRELIDRLRIPVVSSMLAFDVLGGSPLYYGFIGAYGDRAANFIVSKSDLVISIGARMDIRQVGATREKFAPDAQILRFDVDAGELDYKVHENEVDVCADAELVVMALEHIELSREYEEWVRVCSEISRLLQNIDDDKMRFLMEKISQSISDDSIITTDVGQNQVWVAQSFKLKPNQRVLFSGGHGAMGYSLPAAIGAFYGSGKKGVYCITGDGGLQMNIQELQFIARERLPIKVIVLNNNALGMIRHFQEMYFGGNYYQTKPEGGYVAPNFSKIANSYGIKSKRVGADEIGNTFEGAGPELVEIIIEEDTYVIPKLQFGKPNQDQEPLLDRELYNRIMGM